ncbi:MAG: hypothetical protein LBL00_07890 [Endomicrobium sp.]|jgi:hypothetical protein|nr:hypothetical protein [Endomicrobium sp.]
MLTGLLSFLSGYVVPLFAKWFQAKHEEQTVQSQHERDIVVSQNGNSKDITLSNNEVRMKELELAKSSNEITAKANRGAVKWVNVCIDIIRVLFGIAAIAAFVCAGINLWFPNMGFILQQPEFSQAFFIILGFFFGERSVRKAWGN